jgi:hypothetical protein
VSDLHLWAVIEAGAEEIQSMLNVLVVVPKKSSDFIYVIGRDATKRMAL